MPSASIASIGSRMTAMIRLITTIRRWRSHRSTKTPATEPSRIDGMRNASTIAPVASVDPVRR